MCNSFFAIITIVCLSKHICTQAAAGRFLCNEPHKSIYQPGVVKGLPVAVVLQCFIYRKTYYTV